MSGAITAAAIEVSAVAANAFAAGTVLFTGAAASSAAIEAVSTFAYTAATIGITTGLSYGLGLLLQPRIPNPSATQIPLKQSIPPRMSGFGQARMSGTYLLFTARDKTSVNVLAALECGDVPMPGWDRFWLNDDEVFLNGDQGVIAAHGTRYGMIDGVTPRVYFYTSHGQPTETAFAGIISAAPDLWTSAHRGDHIACFGVTALQGKLNDQPGLFPNGDPAPSAVGRLTRTYDMRLHGLDSQGDPVAWVFNRNPVNGLIDFLSTSDRGGLGLDFAKRIKPNIEIALRAANVCDEGVAVADAETHLTTNASIGDHDLGFYGVQGLSVGMTIVINPLTATEETRTITAIAGNTVTLDPEFDFAHSIGEPVTWQTNGTGVEPRYACGGTWSWETDPVDVIGSFLGAMDGWMGQAPDGSVIIRAGKYEEPTVIFDDDIVLGYTIAGRPTDEEAVNQLHISYTDPNRAYNKADAGDWNDPDQTRRGKVRAQPLDLPWVQASGQARRLAKRLSGRLNAPLRGTVTTNLAGMEGLGERYIKLRIQRNRLLRDLPVEITAGPTIDLKALTLTFPWTQADPDIDAWSTAEEQVAVLASPTIEPPTNTMFSDGVFDAASAAIVPGPGVSVAVDTGTKTITITGPTSTLDVSATLTAGQIVNIWSNAGVAEVRPAAVSDDAHGADGFVLAGVASGDPATVYLPGQVITGLSGLTPGALYFLAASGGVTATVPSSGWRQVVGKALTATTLLFKPDQGTLL